MIYVEGLVIPNKALTNLEILDAVRKLEIHRFRGVFLRDNLPVEPKRMECGVLNLDDTSGNGTHWVAWYGDNGKNYYFDSYGIQSPNELKRYLRSPIFYNTEQIQPKQEVFCGHLCLYVLKQLALGKHLQEIVNDLH